jgi:hypothetical protein
MKVVVNVLGLGHLMLQIGRLGSQRLLLLLDE